MKTRIISIYSVILISAACHPEGQVVDTSRAPEVEESSGLAAAFAKAAADHDVPADILKALAYTETKLEGAAGEVEFEGQAPAYGLFGLRGAELELALQKSGQTLERITSDPAADIAAAAALLSEYADRAGLTREQRRSPPAWRPALMIVGGLSEELRGPFADSVLRHLAGLAVPLPDGTTLVIGRHTEPGASEGATATGISKLGQEGTIWRRSSNYDSRAGHIPHLVIIHTCEGGYWGCVDWLRQPVSGVSAHYVVKEDGSETSQLVDENARAWHVGQSYRDWLNSNSHPELQGISVNSVSVGIEHAGFARQSSWPQDQIDASVELVRGITARWDIPRDRYHIVAHGQLQPEIRSDPGPNWPWTSYLAAIARDNPPQDPPADPVPSAVLTVDNSMADRFRASGNWQTSSWAGGRIGADYRFRGPQPIADSADYKLNITEAGEYEVFVRIPGNGYNTNAPYVIHHRDGRAVVHLDISARGAAWVSLGTYSFEARDEWIVQLSCWTNGRGWIIADAVKLEPR